MARATKKNKVKYIIFSIISIILWIVPIAVFTFLALMEGDLLYQKVALSLSVLSVLVMTLVAITSKIQMRSRVWVMMIGIYICIQNIIAPLIIFAACQIADELIISPLKERYKRKYHINKEIDARL